MVEHNGFDYGVYLRNVFSDDTEFKAATETWAVEEVQHGKALGRWAQLADPDFDFDASFARFREGYKLPLDATKSVRGSLAGELMARCIVETGTSSYYTALRDATDEPVLKEICARIAADELRHYKLFYSHMRRYVEKEGLGFWGRLRIGFSRILESEDDELAYAYYAANGTHRNLQPSRQHPRPCLARLSRLSPGPSAARRRHGLQGRRPEAARTPQRLDHAGSVEFRPLAYRPAGAGRVVSWAASSRTKSANSSRTA